MEGLTTSAIISFAAQLEENASKFYEEMARRYSHKKEVFLAFAEENRKTRLQVMRTYRETISDAIEAGFSFKDLRITDYSVEVTLPKDLDFTRTLKIAIQLEKESARFYTDVAEMSKSLLATIPQVFIKVAAQRCIRKKELISLLPETK